MNKSTNTRYSAFPLDKENEKWYSESVRTQLNLSAFDDDEVAGSAVDYLYDKKNQSKTQSFLKNNGFPSAQEREYQARVAGVNAKNAENARKQNDLINAFQDSPFESLLRPSVPVSGVAQNSVQSEKNQSPYTKILQSVQTPNVAKQAANTQFPSGIKNTDYNDKGLWHIETTNVPTQTKPKVSPNAVRANVERAGGTVNWDPESEKATVKINGYTEEFYVGDFALKGNISSIGNNKYIVTINYTLNDIVDVNEKYLTDRWYSAAAKFLGVYGKDYILRISGTATFIYSNHGELITYV